MIKILKDPNIKTVSNSIWNYTDSTIPMTINGLPWMVDNLINPQKLSLEKCL